MSDAKVRFDALDHLTAEPGKEQTFGFNCPKYDRRCEGLIIAGKTDLKRDGQGQNGGIAQWDWDQRDRKSTRLNSSHQIISYAVFCLKKKKQKLRCFGCRCHGAIL